MVCKKNFKFIQSFDLYGREPKLYYKEKTKKRTYFGSLTTIAYIIVYIAFFVYKINKMLKKVDVSFYETYVYTNGTPEIELNNQNFYGGFALGNPLTRKVFKDESVYFPNVSFIYAKQINNEWKYEIKHMPLGECHLNNFGPNHREIFKDVELDNLYCLEYDESNFEMLRGYITTEDYSYIQLDIFPCNNLTSNYTCKPREDIDWIFENTYVEFRIQDLELTPQLYETPVQFERKDIQGVAFKNLYQKIYTHLQIVNIETDEDIFGLKDFLIKNEKYLKYDESYIYTNPREHDIFDSEGEPLCTIIIQLAGKVLTQKRTYPKLIDVLGEVGGCMEVVYSFSKVVLFLITDILYDISLVNNLFSFNISKKIIMIKNLKATKIENISSGKNYKEKNIEINPPIANMSSSRKSLNINMSNCLLSKDSTQNNIISRKKIGQGPLISRNVKLPKRKSYKSKTKIHKNSMISNFNIDERSEVRKISLGGKNSKTEINKKVYNNINTNDYNVNNLDITEVKERNIETEKDKKCDIIIEKIRFNVLYTYFCFLCLRRKKNLQNELLDKGMKLVYQKLDIFNIFKKMYIFDDISEQNLTKIISN
jgi:hypothetical protein